MNIVVDIAIAILVAIGYMILGAVVIVIGIKLRYLKNNHDYYALILVWPILVGLLPLVWLYQLGMWLILHLLYWMRE